MPAQVVQQLLMQLTLDVRVCINDILGGQRIAVRLASPGNSPREHPCSVVTTTMEFSRRFCSFIFRGTRTSMRSTSLASTS